MKIIDFERIRNLDLDVMLFYAWVEEMLKKKQKTILPAKISMKPSNGIFYNVMPTILLDEKRAGVKVVTRYPDRNPSLESQILLYDLNNGEMLAMLDGTYITAMRTGAVAAHSIKLLAKKEFATISFMGLGNTARATLKILLQLYPERPFIVKLLQYKNQHEEFEKVFSGYKNLHFVICNTYQELIKGSDVIVSAVTVLDNDICEDRYFDEGCLLVPIHTRGFTNCDLFFDKVYADDVNHVRGFKNFERFNFFAEVSDVVCGKSVGRESESERILVYNIGIAIHDIYFANQIYQRISEKKEINLGTPKQQFWIS